MKKTIKIVAIILLFAVAVISFFRAIEYAISSYNNIYAYFYILRESGFSDEHHKLSVISSLWVLSSHLLNFIFSIILAALVIIFSHKNISISERIRIIRRDIAETRQKNKSVKKEKKISKMKSKIEKIESDE